MPDNFILTRRAKRDLESIWQYIAADNVNAADNVESAIYRAFAALSSVPNAGHLRRDLTSRPVRFWIAHPHRNYLVVYCPETRPVRIIRILHAALDINQLLR